MKVRTAVRCLAVALTALGACRTARQTAEPAGVETVTATTGRTVGMNATPTSEPGVYRLDAAIEQITEVRIVPIRTESPAGRVVDRGHWSYDPSSGRLRLHQESIDDARELVVALVRARYPREWRLEQGADLSSLRVVVGDRRGVEGRDYVLDRERGTLRLLAVDTPEAPLSYFVQYQLARDPAHPEVARVLAFGNRGDSKELRRLLEADPP